MNSICQQITSTYFEEHWVSGTRRSAHCNGIQYIIVNWTSYNLTSTLPNNEPAINAHYIFVNEAFYFQESATPRFAQFHCLILLVGVSRRASTQRTAPRRANTSSNTAALRYRKLPRFSTRLCRFILLLIVSLSSELRQIRIQSDRYKLQSGDTNNSMINVTNV